MKKIILTILLLCFLLSDLYCQKRHTGSTQISPQLFAGRPQGRAPTGFREVFGIVGEGLAPARFFHKCMFHNGFTKGNLGSMKSLYTGFRRYMNKVMEE